MPKISGEILINLPAELVFDYVANQRNEPNYNPQMLRGEMINDGPIGVGTRFRATAFQPSARLLAAGRVRLLNHVGTGALRGRFSSRRQPGRLWFTGLRHATHRWRLPAVRHCVLCADTIDVVRRRPVSLRPRR